MEHDPIKAKIIELLDIKPRERELFQYELENYGDILQFNGAANFVRWLAEEHFAIDEVELRPNMGEGSRFVVREHRPITLADVLRAINVSPKIFMGDWLINTRGHFVKHLLTGQHIAQVERWDFLADYYGQTQEVRSFIGRLLGVES